MNFPMRILGCSWMALAVAGALCGAVRAEARTVELSDGWEFRRVGGPWERVSVPHDWAIAGPFDKEIDKQVVKILENLKPNFKITTVEDLQLAATLLK